MTDSAPTRSTVTLAPLEPAHAEARCELAIANREHLAPFEPPRPPDWLTVAGQLAYVREQLVARDEGRALRWQVLDAGELVGEIGIMNIVRGAFHSANMGYWIDAGHTGRGIATEAVRLALAYAFDELGLHRIEAGTLVDNVASQRVLERNGFERIGLARRYLRIAGAWRDHLLFARINDAWIDPEAGPESGD